MERSQKLNDLVAFLIDGSSSLNSVSRFLLQNTFVTFECVAILLAFVMPDGSMRVTAGFGYNPEIDPDIFTRSLPFKILADGAFRHNKVVLGGSYMEFKSTYPQEADRLFPHGFEESIAIPMSFLGVMIICGNKKFQITPQSDFFLRAVGEVVALHAARLNAVSTRTFAQEASSEAKHFSALTSRQSVILTAVLRGSTNRTIAEELGFSESLIRHETVEIYRKLYVSGRKELLEREDFTQST